MWNITFDSYVKISSIRLSDYSPFALSTIRFVTGTFVIWNFSFPFN